MSESLSSSTLTAEKVVLDRLRLGASVSVPRYILAHGEVDSWVDEVADQLAFRFRSEVLAQTLSTTELSEPVTFEHPATTWQMFKSRTAHTRTLGWVARRWPVRNERTVKYATVEARQLAVFPDATVVFHPHLGSPVFIQRLVAHD